MPNVDYRQFVDRFQSIERRLRNIELRPNPQLAVATGKTLTVDHSMTLTGADGFTLTIPETGTAVLVAATQTLTNKTLTTPTIGDFSNAQHSHADAAGGGQLSLTTAVSGILSAANGGTGVNNDTRTLAINTNSGTLAFSGAGFTLTVPATGTAALLGTAQTFTAANTFQPTSNSTGTLIVNNASGTRVLTINTTDQRVGIGTTSPQNKFEVSGGNIWITNSADAQIIFRSGNSGSQGASIVSNANGDIIFRRRPSVNFDAMTILGSNGNVGIGTTAPSAQLHVDQSSASGAKPTLRLRQADLSEEFIRFDTTVGTGNPINTTALGAYYGRVRVHVEGVGAKWLALYD